MCINGRQQALQVEHLPNRVLVPLQSAEAPPPAIGKPRTRLRCAPRHVIRAEGSAPRVLGGKAPSTSQDHRRHPPQGAWPSLRSKTRTHGCEGPRDNLHHGVAGFLANARVETFFLNLSSPASSGMHQGDQMLSLGRASWFATLVSVAL